MLEQIAPKEREPAPYRPAREMVGMSMPLRDRRMIEPDHSGAHEIVIEFTLQSGETFSVTEFIQGVGVEDGIQILGEQLVKEMGTGKVHTFTYWRGEQYTYDAVLMDEVAAFSISPALGSMEEVEEEDEE